MGSKHHLGLWRHLKRGASVIGIVALTVFATRVFGPRQAAAQPAQQGDVRATSFTLVGADGIVLGRLAPDPMGNGLLALSDSAGRPRARMIAGGTGGVQIFDANGKTRAMLYHSDAPSTHSGVAVYDADHNLRFNLGYDETAGVSSLAVFDENGSIASGSCGTSRAQLVVTSSDRSRAYAGLRVCDTSGNVIYTAP